LNKYIVAFPVAGVPPVQIFAHRYLRGDKFTTFRDEKGNEIAWFNTVEIGGVWIVNEEPMITGAPPSRRLGRKN
jgi:hypothetical protein